MTSDRPEWVFFMEGDVLMKQRPYCDCEKPSRKGHTRRHDGAWVLPCCMRRTKQAWEKLGDEPVTHNPLTCPYCQEQVANDGNPVLTQNQKTPGRKAGRSDEPEGIAGVHQSRRTQPPAHQGGERSVPSSHARARRQAVGCGDD